MCNSSRCPICHELINLIVDDCQQRIQEITTTGLSADRRSGRAGQTTGYIPSATQQDILIEQIINTWERSLKFDISRKIRRQILHAMHRRRDSQGSLARSVSTLDSGSSSEKLQHEGLHCHPGAYYPGNEASKDCHPLISQLNNLSMQSNSHSKQKSSLDAGTLLLQQSLERADKQDDEVFSMDL